MHSDTADIRAVIFDFGGVMTEPVFGGYDQLPAEYLGLVALFLGDFADLYHLPTGAHDLHLLEIGALSDREFFERLCDRYERAGNPRLDPGRAASAVFGRELVACGAMVDAAREARAAGFKTALLTNISRSGEAIWSELIPARELFDVIIDSSQVGLRKPDPEIYRLTCAQLDVQPRDCLFVDDIACNVEAAVALGMEAIRCHDPVAVAEMVMARLGLVSPVPRSDPLTA
jgi:putative hydrolase of the HAD superfamily